VEVASGHLEYEQADADALSAVSSATHRAADFVAFHEQYRGELGLTTPRDYLVTIGRRR
jgi:hypothetical protein